MPSKGLPIHKVTPGGHTLEHELEARDLMALNLISSPPPNRQPLFQALFSQLQQGLYNPDQASPGMQP